MLYQSPHSISAHENNKDSVCTHKSPKKQKLTKELINKLNQRLFYN